MFGPLNRALYFYRCCVAGRANDFCKTPAGQRDLPKRLFLHLYAANAATMRTAYAAGRAVTPCRRAPPISHRAPTITYAAYRRAYLRSAPRRRVWHSGRTSALRLRCLSRFSDDHGSVRVAGARDAIAQLTSPIATQHRPPHCPVKPLNITAKRPYSGGTDV